jgi:hypothetical protein
MASIHTTQQTLTEIRRTLETVLDLGWKEKSLNSELRGLIGSIDMNLSMALSEKSLKRLLLAIYCLGRMNERFLALAGDIEGFRPKNREFRQEYRSYAEVARECMGKLEALIVEGVSY